MTDNTLYAILSNLVDNRDYEAVAPLLDLLEERQDPRRTHLLYLMAEAAQPNNVNSFYEDTFVNRVRILFAPEFLAKNTSLNGETCLIDNFINHMTRRNAYPQGDVARVTSGSPFHGKLVAAPGKNPFDPPTLQGSWYK